MISAVDANADSFGRRQLRIGAVSYLNSKPLIEGFSAVLPHASLLLDFPSRLADELQKGRLDVALIPSVEAFSDPAAIHAACEDYRAAADIDLEHDAGDAAARLTQPLLVLWGDKGVVGRMFDVEAAWRSRATSLRAAALPCGHFVAEEVPERLLLELSEFI